MKDRYRRLRRADAHLFGMFMTFADPDAPAVASLLGQFIGAVFATVYWQARRFRPHRFDPLTSLFALHHASADHRRVAIAIAAGDRVLEYLVHQLGAARVDAVLLGQLPSI